MAKTSSPLTIWVHGDWINHDRIKDLQEKGHTISEVVGNQPDLILHPAAWRWSDKMWTYLDTAIKEARKVKKNA